ncbi:MAG: D-alanyl-D-alanine carboxypeptidase family protein [Eubacteriales bacterium]|nr:D-alanyl-D-alanine carboxypeptidase family protein [Eubacteriales bacterium]
MFIKRCLSIALLCVLLVSSFVVKTSALSEEELGSPSVVLMEPSTNKILFEKNANEQRACASITKVMTLLLVFEAIEDGKIDYTDIVTTSEHAKSMGGSDIWLEVGEQMTVDEMIKATAVASANDAAVALAEHLCGSESDFVALMNDRAKELGMKNTVFKNCNGLDEDGHLTTAYDVALMSAELIKHEKIFDYTTIWLDTLRGGETQIVNTNKLLKSYDGITGLKTGTTGDAGSCISATATRNNLSLVAVVLGSSTGTERFKDAATLLDYGFANYEVLKIDANSAELTEINVKGGMQQTVPIMCDGLKNLVIKKGGSKNIEQKVDVKEEVEAKVNKGDKVGTVTYTLDGETVAQFDVVTKEKVDKISFTAVFCELMNALVAL